MLDKLGSDGMKPPSRCEIRHPLRFLSLSIDLLTNCETLSCRLKALYGRLLQAQEGAAKADTIYYLAARKARSGTTYHLFRNHEHLYLTERPSDLLSVLECNIGQTIIHHFDNFLVLHAGGVAKAGTGVVIAGGSGTGKSTLVAALAHAGFEYLSDEILLLCPRTLRLFGFPKGITLKGNPPPCLDPGNGLGRGENRDWALGSEGPLVYPAPGKVASSSSVGLVLLAGPIAHGPPLLARISRARGIARLLGHAANPPLPQVRSGGAPGQNGQQGCVLLFRQRLSRPCHEAHK